jgi:hypothetical protein
MLLGLGTVPAIVGDFHAQVAEACVDERSQRGREVSGFTPEKTRSIRNVSIDEAAHARRQDVHEEMVGFSSTTKPTDVEGALFPARNRLDVAIEAMLEPERLPEIATGALSDDPEPSRTPRRSGRHQAVHHFVDRAIAPHRDDEGMARERTFASELDAMARTFGRGDIDGAESTFEGRADRADHPSRGAAGGSWIDDDEWLH